MRDVLVADTPLSCAPTFMPWQRWPGTAVEMIGNLINFPPTVTTTVGALLCFGLRLISIHRGWRVPAPRGLNIASAKGKVRMMIPVSARGLSATPVIAQRTSRGTGLRRGPDAPHRGRRGEMG